MRSSLDEPEPDVDNCTSPYRKGSRHVGKLDSSGKIVFICEEGTPSQPAIVAAYWVVAVVGIQMPMLLMSS